MELSQVLQALRNADAAGDVEAARRLAQIADGLMREQAAAKPAEKPKEGIGAAFGKGLESGISSLLTGLKGIVSPEEAAREGRAREEDISRRYADQVSLEKVKQAYRERGLLPAAGEALSQVPAALAEQAPNIAATLGSARLGAMAGAPFGVPGAVIGGLAGAVAPSLFQQAGSNIQRQAAEGQPISRAAAYGAAVPQAALDVAGTFIPLGRTLAGKALGPGVAKMLEKGAEEGAEKLAKETLLKTLTKGTAVGAVAEIPTEVAQQMLERVQAGLPVLSEDALKEYGETAYQVGLLAPIGAAGRVAERGAARERVEVKAQEAQAIEAKARREQEAAEKQSPEYARSFMQQHEALQKEYDDIGALLKQKLPPGATFADKQTFEAQKKRRKELGEELKGQSTEYNRVKSLVPPEPTPPTDEEQRLAALTPLEYQMEQAGVDLTAPPAEQRVFTGEEEIAPPPAPAMAYAQSRVALANDQALVNEMEPSQRPAFYVAYLMQDPAMAEALVAGDVSIPGLKKRENNAVLGGLKLQLAEQKKQRLEESAGVFKPGAPDIEAQEQAYLEEQRLADAQAQERAAKEQKISAERVQLERIGARPAPVVQYAFPARVNEILDRMAVETEPNKNQAFAGMVQQLQAAPETLQLDRLNGAIRATEAKIAETGGTDIQKTRLANLQKARATLEKAVYRKLFDVAEQAGQGELLKRVDALKPTGEARRAKGEFQLFGEAETAPREVTREDLQERLTRAMASNRLSDDAYEFLSRVEATLPEEDRAVGERGATEGLKPGVGYTSAGTTPSYAFSKDKKEAKIAYPARLEDGTEVTVEIFRSADKNGRLSKDVSDVRVREGTKTPLVNLGKQGVQTDEQILQMLVDIDTVASVQKPKAVRPEGKVAPQSLYELIDQQLQRIESGAEGMARPGAGRKTTLQAFPAEGRADIAGAEPATTGDIVKQALFQQKVNAGMKPAQARAEAFADFEAGRIPLAVRAAAQAKAAVTKRPARDIGKETLRGPSAKAEPLSMREELEPLLQQIERAREEDMGQMQLFPEGPAAVSTERATPTTFKRLLGSKAVAAARETSQQEARAAAQAAATPEARRARQAQDQAEKARVRAEQDKKRQAALERQQTAPEGKDKFENELKATIRSMLTDAERAARDNPTPTILAVEMRQVRGDPQKVLKGYRSRITAITKKLSEAFETARRQTIEGVKERGPYEAALAAYKAAKTSTARANIEPNLAKLEKAYSDAVTNALGARVMPKGLVGYQSALEEMLRRETWLSNLIDEGTVEVAPPPQPRKRKTQAELQEIQTVLNEKEIQEAAARVGAPELDVTATTKSEIEAERKPKGTLYSSKGVGQETAIDEDEIKARKEEQVKLRQKLTPAEQAIYEANTIIKRAQDKIERGETLSDLEKFLLGDYNRSRQAKKAELLRNNKFDPNAAEATGGERGARRDAPESFEEVVAAERDVEAVPVTDTGVADLFGVGKRTGAPAKEGEQPLNTFTLEQLAATATQGPALKEEVDPEDNAAAVMQNIAKTSTSELNRTVAERLKMLLGNTRVEIVKDLRDPDGEAAYGQAASDGSFIRLDAKYGLNERTVLHEGVHAATERVLQKPDDQLTDEQRRAKQELQDLFEAYKKMPGASNANAKTSLSEFVSEALSDDIMQVEMRQQRWTLGRMWDSFKSAILRALGVKTPDNMLDATLAAADALMTKVPRPTEADNALLAPKLLNRPRGLNPALNEADAIGRRIIAKDQSAIQKARAMGTGLAMETSLIDRLAGFERLSKYMNKLKGSQMMYYLRMYDQRTNFTSQSAVNGAPEVREVKRRDGETEYLIESKTGPSLKQVVTILKRAKQIVGDVDATSRLFSLYLIAKRADRVGFDKVDLRGQTTEKDIRAAVEQIKSVEGLQDIFETARDVYNQYNENLVRFAQQAGVFNKRDADALLRAKDYVPYYRERNGVVELTLGGMTPVKIGNIKDMPHLQELIGGEQKIIDFMVSSVQNTNMLVDMSLRNLATRNAVFELLDMGMAKIVAKPVDGANVVRFKSNGDDRYAILDTDRVTINGKTVETGVPADLLVKGMEGIPVQTTGLLRLATVPTQILRRAITLNPLYMMRQLVRDSLSATIASGADIVPVLSSLKEINSATKATLEKRGITGGQVFTGTQEDISKIMRDIAGGEATFTKALSKFEAMGMEADALTRRAQYNSYIKQGMSEMEATMLALESMNFNKRGASPGVHMANSLYPFFNAQIQGLNVLYKAMFGQITAAEKARIKQKLITRGAMLFATSLAYAHAMQDDEAYKNALPSEKYGNWFFRIPGVDEPVRIPIPFEIGYIFKALPEALYNTIMTEKGGEGAKEAFAGILRNVIPGGSSYFIPQVMKPGIEVATNYSFFTERPMMSAKEQALLPEYQYRNNTTELAKLFGGAAGVSPAKLEALISGYFSTAGMALLQLGSLPIPAKDTPEKAERRLSEMPVVGTAFQPNDARWLINSTYDALDDARRVQASYKELVNRGEKAEAKALLDARANDYAKAELAGYYRQQMGMLSQYRAAVNASNKTPQEKREMLDKIRQHEIKLSNLVRQSSDAVKVKEG